MREPIQNDPHTSSNAWKAGNWRRGLKGSAIAERLTQNGFALLGCDLQRERLVLENGISNLEFHFPGSAKIPGGLGKGLAEAMAKLKQLTKTH